MTMLLEHAQDGEPTLVDDLLAIEEVDDAGGKEPSVGLCQDLVEVRDGDRQPDGLSLVLQEERQVGLDDHLEVVGQIVELRVGATHLAPVLLPGNGVEVLEEPDLALELLHVGRPHGDVVALADAVGQALEPVGGAVADVDAPGVQVLDLGVAGALDEARVGWWVLRHHDERHGVVGVDLEARAVVHRGVGRAADCGAPKALCLGLHGREERLRDLLVLGLEEAEERQVVAELLIVGVVVNAGDPAHQLAVTHGQVWRDAAVLEERVLVGVELVELPHAQRRHERRVASILVVP
ncbi:MAG: hypothetical protein P8Z81_16505 [Deinococcales bacterium]